MPIQASFSKGTMRQLSKTTLAKGGSRVILRGMRHAYSSDFYAEVQREMEELSAQGAQVFFEGIGGVYREFRESDYQSRQEFELAAVLRCIIRFAGSVAEPLGVSFQRDSVSYPDNAIRADIDLPQLASTLTHKGVRPPDVLIQAVLANSEMARKLAENYIRRKNGLATPDDIFQGHADFIRQVLSMLDEARDPIVADCIDEWADQAGGLALVHFGQKHLPGITAALQQRGWSVEGTVFYLEDL